jgi:hypothetical protein
MRDQLIHKIGIGLLSCFLFVVQITLTNEGYAETTKAQQESSWKSFQAKDGECEIAFPQTPEMIQQTVPLSDGVSRLNYDIYLAPQEDKGAFMLLIATYPSSLAQGGEMAGLQGLLDGIINHQIGNQLVFGEVTQFQGHVAINFMVKSVATYFRGQAFMIGNKLFLIAMEGIEGTFDEKVYTQFLESFQMATPAQVAGE